MFIGEAPGYHEDQQGLPFVGQSGKYLDELLDMIGLSRDQVFITNVVKCRPPGNRDPQPEELAACSNYLERQIEAINPAVIVTLGRVSMARYLPNARISEMHGKACWIGGRLVVPFYHPAAALHQPSLKKEVIEDFTKLPDLLAQTRANRGKIPSAPVVEENKAPPPPKEDATQLSLF